MKTYAEKIGIICFWIAIVIELIIVMVDKSAYTNPYESMFFRFTFLLFCIKIITTKYSCNEWICIILVGVIAVLSYFINMRDETVRATIFVIACKEVPVRKTLNTVLVITLCGTIILFLLSITGIYGALTMTANFGRGPFPGIVETRYCFGMGHPNAFQCMVFMISSLVLYLSADKMKWYHFIFIIVVNYVFFVFTDSNTAILVTTAVVLGTLLLRYCEWLRTKSFVYIAGSLLVIAIVIMSIIGSHTGIETPFMYNLDQILNGRFQYAHYIENARVENWRLFAMPENQEYFDQGFIRLFYWYGIVIGILYIGSNLYLIWQSYKKKDYCLLVIVVGYAVFSLMEAHLISMYLLRNYLLIWLGYYWYQPFAQKKTQEGYFWQLPQMIAKRS